MYVSKSVVQEVKLIYAGHARHNSRMHAHEAPSVMMLAVVKIPRIDWCADPPRLMNSN